MTRTWYVGTALALSLLGAGPPTVAQETRIVGSPRPGVKERVGAVERLMEGRSDESARKFVEDNFAPVLRSSRSVEAWVVEIKRMRELFRDFGTVRLSPGGESGLAIHFGGCPGEGTPLLVEIDGTAPHWITSFKLGEAKDSASRAVRAATAPITWENVSSRLAKEASDGFSGAVLVVRDGSIVLDEGYGLANREKKIPNARDTVFAIGSTPIDFTQGAILKLADMGKLSLSDSIAKHLPNVPDEKKKITIEHLMTGRSGLPNFHGRSSDADPDNGWIGRDEALRRILESELLFPPGTEHAHSHSAFGVLAAIVEVASGESYIGFLNKHLFGPAGMTRTGHYEDIQASDEQVAIGYGGRDYAAVNSPKHWGKTSWLVLGSGGMVSTTGDLYRWNRAMRSGALLTSESTARYFRLGGGVLVGGNMHGFFTAYSTGPDTLFFLCTNDIGHEESTRALVDALAALVEGPKPRLGISLDFGQGAVIVAGVEPDSPAARAGVRVGDTIETINGKPLGPDPAVLQREVAASEGVELKVKRGNESLKLRLVPVPKQ